MFFPSTEEKIENTTRNGVFWIALSCFEMWLNSLSCLTRVKAQLNLAQSKLKLEENGCDCLGLNSMNY